MTETTPLITGVDFVCVPARDFDAMSAFYGETLGLPFLKRYGSRPGVEYQAGNLTLAIMRTEDFGGTFSPNAMPIALQVDDVPPPRRTWKQRACASSATHSTPASAGRRSVWTQTETHSRCTIATRRRTNPPPRRNGLRRVNSGRCANDAPRDSQDLKLSVLQSVPQPPDAPSHP
jgi:hypothetical protein